MQHPRRWRTIALAAIPVGIMLILAANLHKDHWSGAAFAFTGFGALLCGVFVSWQAHVAARAQSRLTSGEGRLASWRVDPALWQAFLERERTLRLREGTLPNELSLADDIPASGIDVIIGEDAVSVGERVHVLPRHGTPEVLGAELLDGGNVQYAELQLRHPPRARSAGGISSPLLTRLTLPLPASASRDARRAIGFYARGRPGKASVFHGRGDGSDAEDLSTCSQCGYTTHVFRSTCPRCGGGMLSKRWARRFGTLLLVLGGGISAVMAVVLLKLSPMLLNPGVDTGGMRFGGSPAQALAIWAVLAAVLVFGATAASLGAWQMVTGKRNLRVGGAMLAVFTAVVLLGQWLLR